MEVLHTTSILTIQWMQDIPFSFGMRPTSKEALRSFREFIVKHTRPTTYLTNITWSSGSKYQQVPPHGSEGGFLKRRFLQASQLGYAAVGSAMLRKEIAAVSESSYLNTE